MREPEIQYDEQTNTVTVFSSNGVETVYSPVNPEALASLLAMDCIDRQVRRFQRTCGIVGVRRGN